MKDQLTRWWVAFALGVLVSVSIACTASDPASDTPSVANSPASAGTEPGPADVLDFAAPKLGGGTIQGSDYAGQDLAIWFWAPW